ncbi:MAG: acyltransferase family protein, partial [Proteobacteria bacterium]|nr:acyltransferase family protein [Pseudomonadota bacterium]
MRIYWIDTAKALGIIFVLFGHTKGIDPSIKKYLYSFHLPLFFFLSGYLLKKKYLSDSFKNYFTKNLRNIVIPYLAFWALSYPYWVLNGLVKKQLNINDISIFFKPLFGLIYGTDARLISNDVLWYFTCLFCTTIIFYWVARLNYPLRIALLFLLGILGSALPDLIGFRLPWNLEVSFVAVVFFGTGHFCSDLEFKQINHNPLSQSITASLLAVTFLVSVTQNTAVNLSGMKFGNLGYFYLGAFSGISLTILLSRMIPHNHILDWISRNTIIIFPLHIVIFSIFTGIGVLFLNLDPEFNKTSTLSCFVYTFGAIITCIPISYLIRNYT